MPNVQFLGRLPGFGEEFAANFNPMVEGAQKLYNFAETIRTAHLREALAQTTLEKQQLENRVMGFAQENLELDVKQKNDLAKALAATRAQQLGYDPKMAGHMDRFATQQAAMQIERELGEAKAATARTELLQAQAKYADVGARVGLAGALAELGESGVAPFAEAGMISREITDAAVGGAKTKKELTLGKSRNEVVNAKEVISSIKEIYDNQTLTEDQKDAQARGLLSLLLHPSQTVAQPGVLGQPGTPSVLEQVIQDVKAGFRQGKSTPTPQGSSGMKFGSQVDFPGGNTDVAASGSMFVPKGGASLTAKINPTPQSITLSKPLDEGVRKRLGQTYADLTLMQVAAEEGEVPLLVPEILAPGRAAADELRRTIPQVITTRGKRHRDALTAVQLAAGSLRINLGKSVGVLNEKEQLALRGAALAILESPDPAAALELIETKWGNSFIIGKAAGDVLTEHNAVSPVITLLRSLATGDLVKRYRDTQK
jgi:hypothetical protein